MRKIQSDVVEPLLKADDPSKALLELSAVHREWYHLAAAALGTMLGVERAVELAREGNAQFVSEAERLGPDLLGEPATRAFLASVDMITLVLESLLTTAFQGEDAAAAVQGISNNVALHALCVFGVAHYLNSERPEYKKNAQALAAWGYSYADLAYGHLGVAQLQAGLYSRL